MEGKVLDNVQAVIANEGQRERGPSSYFQWDGHTPSIHDWPGHNGLVGWFIAPSSWEAVTLD